MRKHVFHLFISSAFIFTLPLTTDAAATIAHADVITSPLGGHVSQEIRVYLTSAGVYPEHKGEFRAVRSNGEWDLSLKSDTASNGPLEIAEADLLGKEGLLVKCLDQFRADVPSAKVKLVTVELRTSTKLWAGFKERMTSLLRAVGGTYKDPDIMLERVQNVMDSFIVKSPDAKILAALVAFHLGCRVQNYRYSGEDYFQSRYSDRSLSDLAKLPDFGLMMSPSLAIGLEPQKP